MIKKEKLLKPYIPLLFGLITSFITLLISKKYLKNQKLQKSFSKLELLLPYLNLFIFDLLNYILIFKNITKLSKKENLKIEQVKEYYTKFIVTGKKSQTSIHFQKQFNEVKAIIPPKTNLFKVMLSNYIHERLFLNFIIIVFSISLSNIFSFGQIDLLFEIVVVIVNMVNLVNSFFFMEIRFFRFINNTTRFFILKNFGIFFVILDIVLLVNKVRFIQDFESFYLLTFITTFFIYFLDVINQSNVFYNVKKSLYMFFR